MAGTFAKGTTAMALGKLGRYDIIRILGKGAMGTVYEARDPNLERRVAIKTIKVDALSQQASAEYEARFRTEARSAARLQHPHIVSVYDSGRHGDMAYLVMEFVRGDDLKKLLESGITFSLAQATHMMCDLLSALDYAHRQNIVHRDVKPANLLVEADGRVKLTDFGVARIQDSGDATRTRGSMVGTLKYMAPEQVQGLAVDARADIFAAGVLLYQLLTGQRPFDGASDFAIIQQIIAGAPAPPSTINAQLPPAIDAVLAQALAPSREQRFANAQAFAAALEAAVATVADQTIAPPPGRRPAVQWGGPGADEAVRRHGRSGGNNLAAMADTSGSTVTQELELVYWKDVKDSDDVVDLQGFLDRFPHGIYGDLARRRLKRLAGLARGEQTGTELQTRVMDREGPHTGFPDTEQMTDETLLIERSPDSAESPLVGPDDQTLVLPVAPETPTIEAESAQAPTAIESSPQAPSRAIASGDVPERPDSAEKRVDAVARALPIKGLALLASLLVAVALAVWALGPVTNTQVVQASASSGVPTADEGAAAAAAVAPTSEPSAAPPSLVAASLPVEPSSAATHATVTSAVNPPVKAATRPEPTVAKGKPVVAKAVEAPEATAAAATTAASVVRAVPVAASPVPAKPVVPLVADSRAAPAAGTANPEKACEGRVLLGFQTCMNDRCASAEFAAHPVCRQRRLGEQAREARRNNRN